MDTPVHCKQTIWNHSRHKPYPKSVLVAASVVKRFKQNFQVSMPSWRSKCFPCILGEGPRVPLWWVDPRGIVLVDFVNCFKCPHWRHNSSSTRFKVLPGHTWSNLAAGTGMRGGLPLAEHEPRSGKSRSWNRYDCPGVFCFNSGNMFP